MITDKKLNLATIDAIEDRLKHNPQYAYAIRFEQLQKLRALYVPHAWLVFESARLKRGQRLGDIKPSSLGVGDFWAKLFK